MNTRSFLLAAMLVPVAGSCQMTAPRPPLAQRIGHTDCFGALDAIRRHRANLSLSVGLHVPGANQIRRPCRHSYEHALRRDKA